MEMVIITYILIVLYAVLTGVAGVSQLKEVGFRARLFLFIAVSIAIIAILFIPNKDWMLVLLVVTFTMYHILAIAEGLLSKRRVKYSHHIIRFIFHCIMVLMVYHFITSR